VNEIRLSLADEYTARLLALEPRSVLDVGCGAGNLLRACREAGIRTAGVEPGPAREEWTPELGAVRAQAERLPFRDESVEWVTMRHVPHHLEHLDEALREAWRVASVGVLVAEPYYSTDLPGQRLSDRFDRLLKTLDRRGGMFHADNISGEELAARLPHAKRIEIEPFGFDRPWPLDEIKKDAATSIARGVMTDDEEQALENYFALAERGKLTLNGSVVVRAWK